MFKAPSRGTTSTQAQLDKSTLLDLSRSVSTLTARHLAVFDQIAAAEDQIPFDATPERETAEIERLGLPTLHARQKRTEAQLSRAVRHLGMLTAQSSDEVAEKAAAVVTLLGTDPIARPDLMDRHASLILSVLRDAAALGASA